MQAGADMILCTCRYGDRINYAQLVLGAKIWRGPRGASEQQWTTPTFVQPSSSIEDAYLRYVAHVVYACVRVCACVSREIKRNTEMKKQSASLPAVDRTI